MREISTPWSSPVKGILMDFYDVELLHRPHFFKRFIADAARKESRQEKSGFICGYESGKEETGSELLYG